MAGHGSKGSTCGQLVLRGCLDHDKHPDGLDFVRVARRSDMRLSCPVCFEKAAAREAGRIVRRLAAYVVNSERIREIDLLPDPRDRAEAFDRILRKPGKRPNHWSLSPPLKDYGINYDSLRRKCAKICMEAGIQGACLIPHPWRERRKQGKFVQWVDSFHFHAMGFGETRRVREIFRKHGWIIKNHGARKSAYKTAQYQLSHCGVLKGKASVTWFGVLGYRALKVAKSPRPSSVCPYCGGSLSVLCLKDGYEFSKDPPDGDYNVLPGAFEYELMPWVSSGRSEDPLVDVRRVPSTRKPEPLKPLHLLEHSFEVLRAANPGMPEHMIRRFLGEHP
jgi:hypothetical protein